MKDFAISALMLAEKIGIRLEPWQERYLVEFDEFYCGPTLTERLEEIAHARALMSGAVTTNYLRDLVDRAAVRPVPNVRTLDLTEEVTP